MGVCRLCGKTFSAEEIGIHLLQDHGVEARDHTKLGEARRELKKTVIVLRRLEKQGVALADYAAGLRLVANVLGVAVDELASLQVEVAGLSAESLEE